MSVETVVEIEDDGTLSRGSASGSRKITIAMLESMAHSLRVEDERDGLVEDVESAVQQSTALANKVNEDLFVCECGEVFGKQQSYASHQQWCDYDE